MANYNLTVKYKYIFANPLKRKISLAEFLNTVESMRENYLDGWIENDLIYDPLNHFKVTKLNLNKNADATFVELTEMENKVDVKR